MVDRSIPDPATYSAVGRLFVALLVLLLVASGLPGSTDSASSYRPEDDAAATIQLRGTMESISAILEGSESEELAMGWTDLRNDLESVIRDLENRRSAVDIDGLVSRVEGFREDLGSTREMSKVAGYWDELTRILTDLPVDR